MGTRWIFITAFSQWARLQKTAMNTWNGFCSNRCRLMRVFDLANVWSEGMLKKGVHLCPYLEDIDPKYHQNNRCGKTKLSILLMKKRGDIGWWSLNFYSPHILHTKRLPAFYKNKYDIKKLKKPFIYKNRTMSTKKKFKKHICRRINW